MKTAVFRLHNPSKRKRAMLDYALLHNHLAYTKALKLVSPLISECVATELANRTADEALPVKERAARARHRKWVREKTLMQVILDVLLPLPVPIVSKTSRSIGGEIIGQIEAYLESHGEQAAPGLPTVKPLNDFRPDYERALHALANAITLEDQNFAAHELARTAKPGLMRPITYAKTRFCNRKIWKMLRMARNNFRDNCDQKIGVTKGAQRSSLVVCDENAETKRTRYNQICGGALGLPV